MGPNPSLHGEMEFVNNLKLIYRMLKGMINLSLTTAGAVLQKSAYGKAD
jgi:hypothetical protein